MCHLSLGESQAPRVQFWENSPYPCLFFIVIQNDFQFFKMFNAFVLCPLLLSLPWRLPQIPIFLYDLASLSSSDFCSQASFPQRRRIWLCTELVAFSLSILFSYVPSHVLCLASYEAVILNHVWVIGCGRPGKSHVWPHAWGTNRDTSLTASLRISYGLRIML